MKKLISTLLVACSLALPAAANTGFTGEDGLSVLDDPEWRKRFLGSYGFLSGAEPEINASELELLRDVIDLMKANPRAAATMLEQSVGSGSSAALHFILANLQFQNGDKGSAEGNYRAALESFPDFRRAHKNLGLLLVQNNDCKRALPHLTNAVELGDRDGRNYGLIGFCYVNEEKYVAAETAYRNAILQQPDVKDWKLGLARSLLAMERHQEAAALFSELIDENPDDSTAWMLQANAFLGLDEPMAAAVNLEVVRGMGKAPNSSLALLGDIYMNAGMTDLAASAYLDAIAKDEDGSQFRAAYRAAELLVRTRSNEEAGKVLASIDRKYKQNLDTAQELEVLTLEAKLARATGNRQEAAKLLESIVNRDGTRGDALIELADYYRENGDRDRALFLLERAENLEAFEYDALLEHAKYMVADRDYAMAAELLRRALEIKNEPRVQSYLARVEEAGRQ